MNDALSPLRRLLLRKLQQLSLTVDVSVCLYVRIFKMLLFRQFLEEVDILTNSVPLCRVLSHVRCIQTLWCRQWRRQWNPPSGKFQMTDNSVTGRPINFVHWFLVSAASEPHRLPASFHRSLSLLLGLHDLTACDHQWIYRVVQLKWGQLTFLLLAFECTDKIQWFLANVNWIQQEVMRRKF